MMKETLTKLWNEYFSEECAVISTNEERSLVRRAGELHEKANALLDKKQEEAIERYVEALYEIESVYLRKAFLKGCEFAMSFFVEAGGFEK